MQPPILLIEYRPSIVGIRLLGWAFIAPSMRKLTLILDEVYDTETTSMAKNWSMCRGTVRKTGYALRYVEDDLHNLHRALTELSLRLHRQECRKIGPEVPRRRLRWLTEGVIARAEPILDAVKEPGDLAGADIIDHPAKLQQRNQFKHVKPRGLPDRTEVPSQSRRNAALT
jgi:hypothetical protein